MANKRIGSISIRHFVGAGIGVICGAIFVFPPHVTSEAFSVAVVFMLCEIISVIGLAAGIGFVVIEHTPDRRSTRRVMIYAVIAALCMAVLRSLVYPNAWASIQGAAFGLVGGAAMGTSPKHALKGFKWGMFLGCSLGLLATLAVILINGQVLDTSKQLGLGSHPLVFVLLIVLELSATLGFLLGVISALQKH